MPRRIQLGKYELDRRCVAFAGISLIGGSVFSSVIRDLDLLIGPCRD